LRFISAWSSTVCTDENTSVCLKYLPLETIPQQREEENEGSSGCLGIASRTNRSGVPGVERPASDAGEVAVVCLLGFEVEVLEQQAHVVPVLHLEHVGLIGDHKLQRRQEVIVALLITVKGS
jgi:hypothetical protein